MVLAPNYDLELHEMDIRRVFLNDEMNVAIFVAQPKCFVVKTRVSDQHKRNQLYAC